MEKNAKKLSLTFQDRSGASSRCLQRMPVVSAFLNDILLRGGGHMQGQRTVCRSHFSPSSIWASGIKLRSPSLAANPFTH